MLTDSVEELLLRLPEIELQKVLWPLDQVVDLILRSVLNNKPIIQVQVVIKAEHVHSLVVDLITSVRVSISKVIVGGSVISNFLLHHTTVTVVVAITLVVIILT